MWSPPDTKNANEGPSVHYATLSVGSDSIYDVPQRTFFFKLEAGKSPVLLHSDTSNLFSADGFIADVDQDGSLELANKDQEGALFWQIGKESLTLISPNFRCEARHFCANEML